MSDKTVDSFIRVFDAFVKASGYSETYCSRLVFGSGARISAVKAGAQPSLFNLERGIARMESEWPKDKLSLWPREGWPPPKSKSRRNQTELAAAR
jgi:hypothetical protein